jgi:choline dehydrogenase-like flavoprotein
LIGGAHNLVDYDFKVKGMDGLYICDASIFGEYAASNIHSSVVLISDIFSRKLLSIS